VPTTDTDGMNGQRREITLRLQGRRRTVAFSAEKESHRRAWAAFEALRRRHGFDTHDGYVQRAVREEVALGEGESWVDAIKRLQTEWTATDEPLSEAAVLRECLRRAGQRVDT